MHFYVVFNHFSPPNVACVIVPLIHIVSVVVSVSITVPDGGVHNTVDFVFTFVSGVCTHTCYYLFISYLLIICIFIPLYTFHICMNFVHTSIWIFCHTYIICKIFFNEFYLPDVVSLVFELFTIISHESNNVKFVLIHMCDKWCETLYPYYIT